MASLASVATTVPQFTAPRASPARCSVALPAPRRLSVRASAMKSGAAAVAIATGASLLLAGSALSKEVLLGGNDGTLAFVPSEFSVSSGEEIVFLNNAGFPHNVVFDEDEVPGGVDVGKISMDPEDLLNAKGETFKVTLSEKGTYTFYCSPHQGAGMVGKVTVN